MSRLLMRSLLVAADVTHFLGPLVRAFSARRLDVDVFACEGEYCATHGVFSGDHVPLWAS